MSATERMCVYTDGACSGNPGPGGWAWAVPDAGHASGFEPRTTNQRMEITAAWEAVRSNDGPLEVVSDSTYVVNCFRDRWWEGWMRRNWLNSQRKPVANRDLWEPLIELVRSRGDVTFRWVKGHSGDVMNDLVDRLAVEAIQAKAGQSGDRPPADIGPPDTAGAAARATKTGSGGHDKRLPTGWLLGVFGLRPTELGGYAANPVEHKVRSKLVEVIGAHRELHPDLIVVSGARIGAELLGAEAAQELGVRLVVVLPYPNPESVWPAATQERFRRVVTSAAAVFTLEQKVPNSRQQAGAALRRRDAWIARNLDQAVVVWDHDDALVAKLVRTLGDQLGDDVWVIDPAEQ